MNDFNSIHVLYAKETEDDEQHNVHMQTNFQVLPFSPKCSILTYHLRMHKKERSIKNRYILAFAIKWEMFLFTFGILSPSHSIEKYRRLPNKKVKNNRVLSCWKILHTAYCRIL